MSMMYPKMNLINCIEKGNDIMYIKKQHGQVFGAVLTKQEEKALRIEATRMANEIIQESLDAKYDEFEDQIDGAVLFTLYTNFDFTVEQLREFWNAFKTTRLKMLDRYEIDSDEYGEVVLMKLKDIGVDVHTWNQEEI